MCVELFLGQPVNMHPDRDPSLCTCHESHHRHLALGTDGDPALLTLLHSTVCQSVRVCDRVLCCVSLYSDTHSILNSLVLDAVMSETQ